MVPAVSDDRDRQGRAGRDGDRVPRQGHPGGQHPVFAQGNVLQAQGERRNLVFSVSRIEQGLVGLEGDTFRGSNAFRKREGELQDTALLESALMPGGPCLTEFERLEGVHARQKGAVGKMVHGPVPGLDLTGPGSRLQFLPKVPGYRMEKAEPATGFPVKSAWCAVKPSSISNTDELTPITLIWSRSSHFQERPLSAAPAATLVAAPSGIRAEMVTRPSWGPTTGSTALLQEKRSGRRAAAPIAME